MNNNTPQNATENTRREFLTTAAIGTAALSGAATFTRTTPLLGNNKKEKKPAEKRFNKAVKIGMVRDPKAKTLLQKFELQKELGFDGFELNSPNRMKLKEVLAARDEVGLPIHGVVDSVHWRKTLSDANAEVRAEGVKALKQAINDSKAYGGTSVLLVPGVVNKKVSYEQCWKRSIAEIKKVIPLAEDSGIHILIENVWNNFLTSPKDMAKFIDELDSKMVGAYYDVGNSVRYAPTVEWVKTLGKRIVKLDIKEFDYDKGKKQGWGKGFQVKLLEGSCNWPEVMKELKKIGFSGWGTAEIPGGDRKRLTEIARRMDKIFAS